MINKQYHEYTSVIYQIQIIIKTYIKTYFFQIELTLLYRITFSISSFFHLETKL